MCLRRHVRKQLSFGLADDQIYRKAPGDERLRQLQHGSLDAAAAEAREQERHPPTGSRRPVVPGQRLRLQAA
jgi:hypothetical protein